MDQEERSQHSVATEKGPQHAGRRFSDNQRRGKERRSSLPANASVWDRFLWDFRVEDMWGSDRFKDTDRLRREAMDHLLFVSKDDTVSDVLALLTRNRILSLPVYDDDANMFVGSVDVLDLVTFCVKQMGRGTLIDEDTFFKQTPVGRIANISGRNRWTPIDRRAPLRILFDTLSLPGCRSSTIKDKPEQKVLGLTTQSQVLGWLWEQREKEGFPQDVRQLKLRDWKSSVMCGTDMLWLVDQRKTLADAFRTIKRQRVTGVGVTNDAGELIGNVSASDIKVCVASGRALIDLLTMSLERFLQLKGSLMVEIDRPLSHRHPITAGPDDTMEQVLDKLIVHRIHRLWIVDTIIDAGEEAEALSPGDLQTQEEGRGDEGAGTKKRKRGVLVPVGCVSLCDVLNELASFESSEPFVPKMESLEEGYLEDEEDEDEESDFLAADEATNRRKRAKPKKAQKKTKHASRKKEQEGSNLVEVNPTSSATAK